MTIRAAGDGDLDALVKLNGMVQELHHAAHPEWFLPVEIDALRSGLQFSLADPNSYVFVADEDGVVGYAIATVARRPTSPTRRAMTVVELDHIGVAEGARRGGVASLLINRVTELADELNADFVTLTVLDFNDAARRTFAARGFRDQMHRAVLQRS